EGHEDAIPPQALERARIVMGRHVEGVRAAHKAGVRIAAGTDSGAPFHRHENHMREPAHLPQAGRSRPEALVAATSRPAEVVGRPKAGRIAAGTWADFVFVAGDPLRDLDVMLTPKAVWCRGEPVR